MIDKSIKGETLEPSKALNLAIAAVVWIVFFFIFLLAWPCMCCCACCPCCCCKRDTDKKPYKDSTRRWTILLTIIFGAAVVGVALAGIIVNDKLVTGFKTFVCSLVSVMDEVSYGVTLSDGSRWIGLTNAVTFITDLPNFLDK